MTDFELFTHRNAKPRKPATVTITRRSLFLFSEAAFAMLGSPEAVVFLVDQSRPAIGFRAAKRGDPDSYLIRQDRSHGVRGLAICNFLDLDRSQSRRYPLLTAADGQHHISLAEPGEVVTSNRAKVRIPVTTGT